VVWQLWLNEYVPLCYICLHLTATNNIFTNCPKTTQLWQDNSERKCADNYNKWHNKSFFLKLQSAFWSVQTITVFDRCVIKLLPFIWKIYKYLAVKMASPGNRHWANCRCLLQGWRQLGGPFTLDQLTRAFSLPRWAQYLKRLTRAAPMRPAYVSTLLSECRIDLISMMHDACPAVAEAGLPIRHHHCDAPYNRRPRSNSFELDYFPRYTLEENVTGLSKGFGQNFSNLHTIPYHTIFV